MKENERRAMSIRESDNRSLPDLPFSSKKNESEGQRHSSVMSGKDGTLAKTNSCSGGSMMDRIAHIFGVKEIVSKPEKIECKVPPCNELPSRQSHEIDSNFSKVPKQLKAHDETIKYPERQKRTRVAASDINGVSVRLSELEEHVMDMHSAFDEFVLQADKYMNYEQFIEMRREIEDKIKLLDKIEKSLEDSREQILKDSGYMDSILGGFKYTKKRIEILEKRVDRISKSDGDGSQISTVKKLVSPFGLGNVKHKIDSLKLSGMDKSVSELKSQVDGLKQRDADILKELETLKENNRLIGKKPDNESSEIIKSVYKEIDGLKERMAGCLDSGKLGRQLEDIRKSEGNVRQEFESLREKMVSHEALEDIKNKVDELLSKAGKKDVDEPKLKKDIEEEIVKDLDVDEKVKMSARDVKKEMKAELDALKEAQGGGVGRTEIAEFGKRQDELKKEIAMLKKDIRGMSGMQDSMEQISAVVNNLREEIRKEVDEKLLQSEGSGTRDDDLAEIRGNIEKLKAMSQEL